MHPHCISSSYTTLHEDTNGNLWTNLHSKPTDNHSYLFSSALPLAGGTYLTMEIVMALWSSVKISSKLSLPQIFPKLNINFDVIKMSRKGHISRHVLVHALKHNIFMRSSRHQGNMCYKSNSDFIGHFRLATYLST